MLYSEQKRKKSTEMEQKHEWYFKWKRENFAFPLLAGIKSGKGQLRKEYNRNTKLYIR